MLLAFAVAALVYLDKSPIDFLKSENSANAVLVDGNLATESSEQASKPVAEPLAPQWELSDSDGLGKLWLAATDLPPPSSICPPPDITRLSCGIGTARVWNELVALNRPVLLETVTQDKFFASVLLFQIDGSDAIVWTDQGLQWVALSDIADDWTGTYRFFGRPRLAGSATFRWATRAPWSLRLRKCSRPLTGWRWRI